MALAPRMLQLRETARKHPSRVQFHEVHTWMDGFGARSAKPTRLYSSEKWLPTLARPAPKGCDSSGVVVCGPDRRAVSGGPRLKQTQEYPEDFARAIRDGYR